MRKTLALMAVVLSVGMAVSLDADAKRLGGGKSAGMQRQSVTAPAQNTHTGANPAGAAQTAPVAGAAATAAPAAAAAATKRSWMGPIAGIAAGLGLAALASHFGFGEALANIMTMALIGMAVLALIGFVMRKRMAAAQGGMAPAGAGMAREPQSAFRTALPEPSSGSMIGSRIGGGLATNAAAVGTIPAGFDKAGFERTARDQFLALQAANDAGDLDRLRDYLSPEMFEVVRAEIAERGTATQKTEVFGLQSEVIDVSEEAERYVVSVRFRGGIREQFGAETQDLDEVWHLTKGKSGFGGWMIAGIQQAQ